MEVLEALVLNTGLDRYRRNGRDSPTLRSTSVNKDQVHTRGIRRTTIVGSVFKIVFVRGIRTLKRNDRPSVNIVFVRGIRRTTIVDSKCFRDRVRTRD